MLEGIPAILSPELMRVMMEMGHGDELVLADGNFPSAKCAQRLIRVDGHDVSPLLDAVLRFFPLDRHVHHPVTLMAVVDGDSEPDVWKAYETIIAQRSDREIGIEKIGRYDFYDRAEKAFAVVATGDLTLYANIILKKGCVRNPG